MNPAFPLIFLALAHLARAAIVIEPAQPGNAANLAPFATDPGPNPIGMRYQQVYGAPAFSSVIPFGGMITAISFAFEGNQVGGSINARIDFSTTLSPVNSLSAVFADNVGVDNQVVMGPGEIDFRRSASGSLDVTLNLTTPFYYNPAAGNLLMDVRLSRGYSGIGLDARLDASSLSDDQSSRVYTDGTGINSPIGRTDSIGLVTAFNITPVPEPGTGMLVLAGICAAYLFGRRKNQPNRKE